MADNLQATPRNQLLGLLSDAMYGGLDWMKSPERTQQMQGLAGLLESTRIPQTTQRMAYGEPLTNIGRANVPLLKPETAEAMMNVAPFAPAVGKAGKAVARMTGSEINAAMMGERGGLLGAVTPQPMRLDVYHGSPHGPFRQFDPTKIGTGEGAQVYGYGHYLGEARGTGERYRDTLAYKAFDLDPEAKKLGLNLSAGTRGEFIRQTRANKSPEVLAKQLQNANIAARDLPQDKLAELFKAYKEKGGGYLYKVDLPDEQIANMLDWENPVPESMRQKISQPMMERFGSGATGTSGEKLYKEIQKEFERAGSQNPALDASNFLKEQGITGIRYLDQMSRRPGVSSMTQSQIDARIDSLKADIASGLGNQKRMKEILSSLEAERANHPELTSNFVVFPGNENLLTIKEINDQPASLLFPSP